MPSPRPSARDRCASRSSTTSWPTPDPIRAGRLWRTAWFGVHDDLKPPGVRSEAEVLLVIPGVRRLPDDEVRHVRAGDGPAVHVGHVREHPILARAWPVGEHHRADDHPVQPAGPHHRPLAVLVGVDLPEQGGADEPVVHEAAVPAAVAGADAGDADQPPDAVGRHGRDEGLRPLRQQRHFGEQRQPAAEGTDDDLLPAGRPLQARRVEHVPGDDPRARQEFLGLLQVAGDCRDLVPGGGRLPNDLPPRPAGAAD